MSDQHREQFDKILGDIKQRYSTKSLGKDMLDTLFARNPEALRFFEGVVIEDFTSRKFNLIAEHVYDSIVSPDHAQFNMVSEIYRHRYNKIFDAEYYYVLVDCFLDVIKEKTERSWTEEENTRWLEIQQAAKNTIQLASQELAKL